MPLRRQSLGTVDGGTVQRAARWLKHGDLSVDLHAYRVRRANRLLSMGPTEFRLLCYFLRNPEKVHTREELVAALWQGGGAIDLRTVDVHVARLRRALTRHGDADPIRTRMSA